MGRKWTILNQYISVNTDIDGKWLVIFEHIFNRLLVVMFVYPNLNTIFLLFFLFLFWAIYFQTAKRTAFKIWAIEDIK